MFKFIGVVLVTVIAILFNNCSKIGFETGLDSSSVFSNGSGMVVIESGRLATNKQKLDVELVGVDTENVDKIRIANAKEVVNGVFPATAQWIDYTPKFKFDLSSDFAFDGSKDEVKKISVEIRPKYFKADAVFPIITGSILLDTVAPVVEQKGLMKEGLTGVIYSKGQTALLDWTATDPAASTGSSSGIDPKIGIQIGWTDEEDCSKISPANLGAPRADDASARKFVWPKASRLEGFFICVFARDSAGNRVSALSQPLTQLWQVIAGDNNLGNGSSMTAGNVRFGNPAAMAVDSKGGLIIWDPDFFTIRKVSADGIISTLLGSGRTGAFTSNRFTSPIPSNSATLAVDSKDRIYFGNGTLNRFSVPDEKQAAFQSQALISGNIQKAIIQKFSNGVEYLIFSTATFNTISNITEDSYLYKMPIAELDKLTAGATSPVATSALTKYRIAGTGVVNANASSNWIPNVQVANQAVIPQIGAIAVDENEDIYISTFKDGNGLNYGEHAVFVLRKDLTDGVNKVYKISGDNGGPAWTRHLALVKSGGIKYLIAHGTVSLNAIPLEFGSLPVSTPPIVKKLSDNFGSSIAVIGMNVDGDSVFLVGDWKNSRIRRYEGLKETAAFGREVAPTPMVDALSAVLNTPTGVTEDKNGNVYFFEALSSIVRKLDTSGNLTVFAGQPMNSGNSKDQSGKTLSEATFDGDGYIAGHSYPLEYDSAGDRLILGLGRTSHVYFMPLDSTQTVQKIKYVPLAPNSFSMPGDSRGMYVDKNLWPVVDIRLDGNQLMVSRRLTESPFRSQILVSSLDQPTISTPLIGNEINNVSDNIPAGLSKNVLGLSNSVAIRSETYLSTFGDKIFYSAGGLTLNSDGVNSTKWSTSGSGGTFEVTGDDKGNVATIQIDSNDLTSIHSDLSGKVSTHKLCMPGSFLRNSYVKLSHDKNSILISDTLRRRVLRYWIRENGKLIMYKVDPSTNKCVVAF